MNTLYNFFDNNFILALIIMLYIFVIMYFMVFIKYRALKRKRYKLTNAFDLITEGFSKDTIEDTNDIQLIFKRCVANYFENMSFADFLERYIIELHSSNIETAELKSIKRKIKVIIEDERREKPFDGVNDHERRLLSAIEDGAKHGETSSITHNLDELAIILKGNQKKLKTAIVTNNWTIPISIVGLILTIATWYFSSTSISQEDMNKLNDNIRTSIETTIVRQDSLKMRYDNKQDTYK